MMSMALDIDSNKGMQDYGQLLAQNKALHSELTQCQADKEFVWSLWKRLQVSNPDVTEAISLVIQREKEKAEAKDLKVLEILQVKDDRIEELQNIVTKQSQEISELLTKKLDLQEKCGRLQAEAERASDQLTGLELKVRGQETKERSMDDTYRRTVEESQREKYELQRKVTTLTTELEVAKEERAGVTAKRLELERTVRNLERDVSEKVSRFDGLISELEDTRRRAEKAERQVQQLNHEVDFKNQELESIRKELKELWNSHNQMTDHSAQQAQLIQQLQSLQHDTHIMIKNQEDAFSVETRSMQQMYQDVCGRYESAKQVESDLRQQILVLKKELLDREDEVNRLQEQTKAMCEQLTQTDRASPFLDADLAAADRSTLEARRDLAALRQLEKTIEKLDQSMDQDRDATLEFDVSHSRRSARHSTPSRDDGSESGGPVARRARSLSPQSYRREAVEKRRNDQQRVSDLQKLLELKDKELEAIRRAHANRLERLRSVQRSEKLLQEQIKTYEEHQPSRKKKKVQRSDPRQLQRENSDAAWNELSYFKAQHRKLEVERVSLQEEVDELRVQASMDAATLHELRVRLQAQTEEFEYQLKKSQQTKASQSDMEGELLMLRSRVQNKDAHIGKLEKDLQEMTGDRDTLLEEKKALKNQTNKLQQELSQSRIQIADLKHDLQRKQHALEESLQLQEVQGLSAPVQPPTSAESAVPARRKPTHRFKKSGVCSSSIKQYQRTLNRSIEKMSGLFSNFPEEGWEEMSDTGETEEEEEEEADTEATADSLGVAIVHQAQRHPGVSDSSVDATPSTGHHATPVRPTASKTQGRGKMQTKPRRTPRKAKNMQKGPSKPSESLHIHIPSPDRPDSERRSRSRSGSPVTARERVVLREVATSPVSWSHREKEETTPARTTGAPTGGHQLSVLKRRIAYLTRQLAVLRATRAVGLKKFAELKANNEQLTSDMNQAHQRLRNAKLTCQRLSADVERLQREKQNLDQQLSVKDRSEETEKHSDGDRRLLEARLKMSTSEVTRQAATIRSLKTELDTLQDQNRSLQDRVNHLERDNNQKRNLVESQRIKLKASQDATKIHDDTMEELQTKVKLSAENVEKMRIQLDSLKKRMRVVTQEKRDYEDKYLQASLSLEKKTKELSIVREQRSQLESAMSQLESLSQKQLQRVASHSEAAVDAAQAQVSATHSMLAQYQQFVKLLCGELLDRVARTRGQLREAAAAAAAREEQARADHDSDTASLKRAQDTARDILNISQSDLEDIMSADGDHAAQESSFAQEGKRDKKWLRKCEKVIGSKEEFVRPLVSLILQKVDERADLLMRLTSS